MSSAPEDFPQLWPGVVGFIIGVPCGFVLAMLGIYYAGTLLRNRLATSSAGTVLMIILLLAPTAAAVFAGVRFARRRRIFLAGAMFGLAVGAGFLGLAIGLMGTSTGHGVVS